MAQAGKHIVFISPGFPLDEQDYLCIPPLQLFARELSQTPGIRLSVISLQYPYKAATTTWHGIPVRHCGGNNAGFPLRLRTWWRCLRHFRDLHRKHPVDVVHTFWYNEAAYLGQRLERQHGCRHICTLMGQDALPQNAYLARLRLRDMTTVAISERQSEAFARATGSFPDHLIHWGLPAATDALPAGRPIDVLGVGSLTPLKDYGVMLDALARLLPHRPELRAELIGYGPERPALEQRAQELGLSKVLTFRGELSRTQVMETMARSKVLFHPSQYESFGFVYAEALQAGMAIISRPTGVAAEGPGWHLASTAEDLTKALLNWFAEPRSLSRSEPFPLAATVEAYREVYAAR